METYSTIPRQSLNPRPLIFRGMISVIFGILLLIWPTAGLIAIALLYGAYAFVDGILAIGTGIRQKKLNQTVKHSWSLPIVEGILGIAAGIITFFWPGITLFALSILIGIWALITGFLELIAAFSLHRPLLKTSTVGRVLLGLAGILSIFLGVLIFLMPQLGAIALLTLVAGYSILFGGLLMGLGFHLRREQRLLQRPPTARAA